MKMKKRLAEVEDHALTPKEAVILWTREAQEFDSLLAYNLWLQDQPDEIWPLTRMPARVVEAVRHKNPEEPDELLRDQFYLAQRDLVFLFFLHGRLNLYAAQEEEAVWSRLALLSEQLRGLIHRKAEIDGRRLENLQFPEDLSELRPSKKRKKPLTSTGDPQLDKDIAGWAARERELRARVLGLSETGVILARRYLGGEELFFAQSRRRHEASLEMLAGLRALYRRALLGGPPPAQEDLLVWVIENEMARNSGEAALWPEPPPEKETEPDVRDEAAKLAQYLVVVAKADALQIMGEGQSGSSLLSRWVQTEMKSSSSGISPSCAGTQP